MFRIAILPDLHFGPNKNNELLYRSITDIVFPQLNNVDLIVIAGDDTDERLSFDQRAAAYYLSFVNNVVRFKKSDGSPIPVRWVSGTESHQKGQLQAFQYLTSDPSLNVKIFETVSEENIYGMNILYVPEESVYDKREFYKDTIFSGKSYDLCFGHGMFDFVGNNGWGYLEERSLKGSPVWNWEDFGNVLGGVYFGHIHKAQSYKDRIYYGGSLTRFCQGEDEPKGFMIVNYDEINKTHSVEFIENPYAPIYKTIQLTKKQLDELPVEEVVNQLISRAQNERSTDLRVIVDRNNIDLSKLQILKKYFSEKKEYGIRIELKKDNEKQVDGFSGNGQTLETEIEQNSLSSKHPGIIDPNDWENNTVEYARDTYGFNVDINLMHEIINKSMQM